MGRMGANTVGEAQWRWSGSTVRPFVAIVGGTWAVVWSQLVAGLASKWKLRRLERPRSQATWSTGAAGLQRARVCISVGL